MFHFHSLLIYFSIYIVTSKGFSQFCNSHAYSIPLAYAGLMLYAIPSLLDIYTIDAHSIHFQFCSLIAFPSLLEQCYILMQYLFVIYSSNLVLFLVSFNVYPTPSLLVFCFYKFYTFQIKFDCWVYPRFKAYYFDKFDQFVLFLNILTNYFTVSHCIAFLFCIYNFRKKSQFHVKWICRNKFIFIIIK